MKMKLKHIKKINLKIDLFTKKNYFIFLVALLIVSIITGIIFFILLKNEPKTDLVTSFNNDYSLKDSYNYLNILFSYLKNNLFNALLIWILGISVIGCLFSLFLYFMEGFSLGIIISTIIYQYKYKGILGIFLYLFPSKLLYLINFFILTYFSILFSINLLKSMTKTDDNLKIRFIKYLKILGFCVILMIVISLLETFVTPFMIKAFTFFLK